MTGPTAATAAPASPTDTEPGAVVKDRTIHVGKLTHALGNSAWIIFETVVVPAIMLYVFIRLGHAMAGVAAVFAWRLGCIATRRVAGKKVPATVWLVFAVFAVRTALALAVTSVTLYLWQPVVMTAGVGLVFVASAFASKPLIMRLAGDFVHLPEGSDNDPTMRRMFAVLSAWWGVIHVISAVAGGFALQLPDADAVAVSGALSIGTTVTAVAGCVALAVWQAARIPGLKISMQPLTAPALCPITNKVACAVAKLPHLPAAGSPGATVAAPARAIS